jgi:hypothetical protein
MSDLAAARKSTEPGQYAASQPLIGRILNLPILKPVFALIASSKALDRLAACLFAMGIVLVAAYAVVRPDYNWDMVAYVGTALEDKYQDPVELHRETWSRIDAGASERQQYHLKYSNPYNVHQWENPVDFQSQLSMYRVKYLYIAALRALDPIIGVVNAAFVLSVVPSLMFGALTLWWLWRENALQSAFLMLPLLMLADYLSLSTVVTPDILVTVIGIAAVYCLFRKHDWFAATLLVLSVAIRPDNLVMIIAAAMTAALFGWRKAPMLVALIAGFAVVLAISKTGHHPGWWPHFYFSNIRIQNSLIDFHPAFSLYDMARGYMRGLVVTFQHNDWLGLLALLLGSWALLAKANKIIHPRVHALCFMMTIATFGKFASFPLPDDRFYFIFIAAFALILMSAWKPQFQWDIDKRAN